MNSPTENNVFDQVARALSGRLDFPEALVNQISDEINKGGAPAADLDLTIELKIVKGKGEFTSWRVPSFWLKGTNLSIEILEPPQGRWELRVVDREQNNKLLFHGKELVAGTRYSAPDHKAGAWFQAYATAQWSLAQDTTLKVRIRGKI